MLLLLLIKSIRWTQWKQWKQSRFNNKKVNKIRDTNWNFLKEFWQHEELKTLPLDFFTVFCNHLHTHHHQHLLFQELRPP